MCAAPAARDSLGIIAHMEFFDPCVGETTNVGAQINAQFSGSVLNIPFTQSKEEDEGQKKGHFSRATNRGGGNQSSMVRPIRNALAMVGTFLLHRKLEILSLHLFVWLGQLG